MKNGKYFSVAKIIFMVQKLGLSAAVMNSLHFGISEVNSVNSQDILHKAFCPYWYLYKLVSWYHVQALTASMQAIYLLQLHLSGLPCQWQKPAWFISNMDTSLDAHAKSVAGELHPQTLMFTAAHLTKYPIEIALLNDHRCDSIHYATYGTISMCFWPMWPNNYR